MADPIGPYSQDVLTSIVNVQWGGGTYVTGSQWFFTNPTSDVWTNKIASADSDLTEWKKTFSSPREGNGFMLSQYPGSAVCAVVGADPAKGKKGTPIFVLGGLADAAGGPQAAMMMTSPDGENWTPQTFVSSGEVYLLTWNEAQNALYAGMQDFTAFIEPDYKIFDVVLRSTDGLKWTEVERKVPEGAFTSPVEKYCSDKVKDVHGNNVPTSVFGYDEDADILITPDPVSISFGVSYPSEEEIQHGLRLKIIRGPRNEFPDSSTESWAAGKVRAWAVAYATGIWQVAGVAGSNPEHGVVATSADGGDTWKITLTSVPGYVFSSMAAGTKSSGPGSARL